MPYYTKDPKRDHNFDNPPYTGRPQSCPPARPENCSARLAAAASATAAGEALSRTCQGEVCGGQPFVKDQRPSWGLHIRATFGIDSRSLYLGQPSSGCFQKVAVLCFGCPSKVLRSGSQAM